MTRSGIHPEVDHRNVAARAFAPAVPGDASAEVRQKFVRTEPGCSEAALARASPSAGLEAASPRELVPSHWKAAVDRFDRLELPRGGSLLVTEWRDAVMIHFSVPPAQLQPLVPFALDCHDALAFVSCVAFTMCGTHFAGWLRRLPRTIHAVADHGFLNVRTYVCVGGETGIYFLSEWLPRRMNVGLGPRCFGLPYRRAGLDYDNAGAEGRVHGTVEARPGLFAYGGEFGSAAPLECCPRGSLDEFLMERYTAFTCWRGIRRLFRIVHEPWLRRPLQVSLRDDTLLKATAPWYPAARLSHACHSPGVAPVLTGRPHRVRRYREATQ